MKYIITSLSLLAILAISNIWAADKVSTVSDEATLIDAFSRASADSSINKIVFAKNALITLNAPVIYTGTQSLSLKGNGATIDGAKAGHFTLDDQSLASTKDGTLVFNTAADITIQKLSIINSATRGIVIDIPHNAQGDDIHVSLDKVEIRDSALYGLHIDDNEEQFDDGEIGSAIGIALYISHSSFIRNGIGAIDFDGIRVDERGRGGIHATIIKTHIDGNGGDGLELDEAGEGNVDATLKHVTFNDNGFYNQEDLDDGFDIDERGAGDIEVSLFKVLVNRNQDEGLDFDEADEGSINVNLRNLIVMNTIDEGIKIDERGVGSIDARFSNVMVMDGNDDGIQMTEQGAGHIDAELIKVSATDNKKYGVQIDQWFEIDEKQSVKKAGSLKVKKLTLSGNYSGDMLQLHNMVVVE